MTKANHTEGLDILDFLSLEEFLQVYYSRRKQRQDWFSYRYWGSQLDIDPGYLLKLTKGQLKPPLRMLEPLCNYFHFGPREQVFLEKLIEFERAKTPAQIREKFEALLDLRKTQTKALEEDKYLYFTHWYMPVLRSLIELDHFADDYAMLGQMLEPPLPAGKCKDAVLLLERLGMIRRNQQDHWELTDKLVSTGDRWHSAAIETLQQQLIRLGEESIERTTKEQRDVSSITLSVNEDHLDELKAMIRDFRQKVLKWVQENRDENHVVQLNMQLFPVSKICPQTWKKED